MKIFLIAELINSKTAKQRSTKDNHDSSYLKYPTASFDIFRSTCIVSPLLIKKITQNTHIHVITYTRVVFQNPEN